MTVSQDSQVIINGVGYQLQFDLRCIFALQDKWGLDSDDAVLKRLEEKKGLRDLVDLFWGLTREHHRDMTPDDALDVLSAGPLGDLATVFEQILVAAMPPKKKHGGPPQKGQRTKTRSR